MSSRGRIQVVSPMWPTTAEPHFGVFAKNLSEALRQEGFNVHDAALIRGKGRGRLLGHLGLLQGLARSSFASADLLYVHAPTWFGPAALLSAIAGRKQLVVHTHGGEVFPYSRMERATRDVVGGVMRIADLVIAPSRYYAGQLIRAFGLDEARVFVSPSGGIDTRRFQSKDRATARGALGLRTDGAIVGYVGRIERDKGWETILLAARALRATGRDVRVMFCGDGSDREALERRAAELGLADQLIMLGLRPQSELPDVYQAMDVFAFPTERDSEALGLVPIEALACGVPVVGSDRYAVPEYVLDGKNGFLASPADHQAFARAIAAVLDLPPESRAKMSAEAIRMGKTYDAHSTAQALALRLDSVLRKAPSPRS